MTNIKDDKPIPAIISAGILMFTLLIITRSMAYSICCSLFAFLLFHGQNQPKVK